MTYFFKFSLWRYRWRQFQLKRCRWWRYVRPASDSSTSEKTETTETSQHGLLDLGSGTGSPDWKGKIPGGGQVKNKVAIQLQGMSFRHFRPLFGLKLEFCIQSLLKCPYAAIFKIPSYPSHTFCETFQNIPQQCEEIIWTELKSFYLSFWKSLLNITFCVDLIKGW